jgi:hypothetical protein
MNAISEDLWPPDIADEIPVTPASILKAQASRIGEKTKNIIEGRVDTTSSGEGMVHSFRLVAPALDNYSYELFRITHSIRLYPVTVMYSGRSLRSEQELVAWLRELLSSPETKRIVGSLIAQSS